MTTAGSPFDPTAWGTPAPAPGPLPDPPKLRGRRPRRRTGTAPSQPGRGTGWATRPAGSTLRHRAGSLARFTLSLALGLGAGLAAKMWLLAPYTVPTASMDPTLKVGDTIVAEKLSTRFDDPVRGQVVVFDGTGSFDKPGDPPLKYVKRVLAVGGDTIVCCDAKARVVVNGTPVLEPYLLPGSGNTPFRKLVVPDGHLFVMGDNRAHSDDSRYRGTVPVDRVIGRVLARVRPLDRVGTVPRS